MKGFAVSSIVGLALLGCAVQAPRPPVTGVEPPAAWTAGATDAAPIDPGTTWWAEFEDPRLDDLIARVLTANHDLAAAAARVDAAVAQARIAGADLSPAVAAGVDAGRARRNFVGFPIPGSTGGVLSTTSTTVGANLNVSWEADLWGRIRAGRAGAQAAAEAAELDYAAVRLSLTGQTAKAWFAAREAGQQVQLAERILDLRRSSREWIERRYRRGTRGALDLRLAIANEYQARADLEARRRQRDATLRQLSLLLSEYPAAGEPAPADVELPAPPVGLPPLLPAELVSRRPDLGALEQRLAASGFDVTRARASLYPRLSLTGSAGRLSDEVEDLLDSDFSVWSLATNLLQPLFQGGRLRAGVELAEARQRELAESYAQALLAAFAEVELALVAESALALQLEALDSAAAQATAARELARRRYESGLGGYLEVLEAQREETRTQTALLNLRRQRLEARVDLHLALGGGTAPRSTIPAAAPSAAATRRDSAR